MWFSFWRPRDRFSLDELRFLTDQLQKVQIVNEVNKDFVVEALRSIAEILTYGDQHDPSYFEFFMEKQVMGEFVRILRLSKSATVSVQLLQTMSIMIQNLKSEYAVYYLFSNEHINYLITYTFDFRNEELLSYYISFLRAISGKLNKNTISLLLKTIKDTVVSFPLYVEAIRFAFHEENMIRTAVRALTLNVYHVGDGSVNKYVSSPPHAEYFLDLVSFFCNQCVDLSGLLSETLKNPVAESRSKLLGAIDEIEDNLYYFSDVISAGIPDVGKLITDHILQRLVLPLVLPSLFTESANEMFISSVTSLYLLCCILRIVKIKDLANTIAASFFCPLEAFILSSEVKLNGFATVQRRTSGSQHLDNCIANEKDGGPLSIQVPGMADGSQVQFEETTKCFFSNTHLTLREALLSFITSGDDIQALGSLFVLATLLQTKELEEPMLDAFGILPQRKQHKKLLLQALVGEDSDEEQLFSSKNCSTRDGISSELDASLQRLKEQFGLSGSFPEVGMSSRVHRHQVVDALVALLCRANMSAETLWDGGWLLRQLLPYSEAEFNCHHLKMLKAAYEKCTNALLWEIKGTWSDLLITVLLEEWRNCKRAIEAPTPRKEPKCILLQMSKSSSEDNVVGESSFASGERMCEIVKVFVLLHQLQMFSLGRALAEQPLIHPPIDPPVTSRATTAGLSISGPKPGTELKLVDAVPCRIAFERGKERHFSFLPLSLGVSGWIILAEEFPLRRNYGVVRVAAPLPGCNPRIDDKHPRWLHLRIRPSALSFLDLSKRGGYEKLKSKGLIDGRWTLAFRDDESCKSAMSMTLEEIDRLSSEVERRLKPLLELQRTLDRSNPSDGSSPNSSASD